MKLSKIILLILAILLAVICILFAVRSLTTAPLTVKYKNISSVQLYGLGDGEDESLRTEDKKPVATIRQSGQSIRLPKGMDFLVVYKGENGFADGKQILKMGGDGKVLSLNPYFSEDRLRAILPGEIAGIHSALNAKFSGLSAYSIAGGELYHTGNWYGTTLIYVGGKSSNNDSLRVILEKVDGVWVVRTDPPNISLNRFDFPKIPQDVLDSVNRQTTPELKNPYSGGAVIKI